MRWTHYSPLLKMLWNFNENVMVLSDFNKWGNVENEMLKIAEQIKEKENLDIAILDFETYEERKSAVITSEVIKHKAEELNLDYVVDYSINDIMEINFNQLRAFKGIKIDLNVQKIIVNLNLKINNEDIDQDALIEVFGKENVIFVELDEDLKDYNSLKELLNKGKVKEYKNLTGVYYSLLGHIESGKQVGRIIGYPTINLPVYDDFPLKQGVYYASAKLPNDDVLKDAMTCYWTNTDGVKVVETYIFNFNETIYGWGVEINFIDFIRDNVTIKNLDELKELLSKDEKHIKEKYLGDK